MKKFLIKNKENIEKLDKYIDENRNDIWAMIVSPEIFAYFKEYCEYTDYMAKTEYVEELMKYKGIKMVRDSYSPAPRIYFVRKSESMDFNLPCVCGIYQDEIHP